MRRNLLFKLLFAFSSLFVTNAVAQTYCTTGLYGSSNCNVGDNLNDVVIGNFSHLGTGCSTNGYGDFTGDTISIPQSTPTAVGITSGYSSQWYAIWIDANNDGDFDDAGEHLWSSTSASGSAGTVTSGQIAIDTSIATGTYRLRVRGKFSGTQLLASQSCSNFSYGEVHDYTVNVLPPPACPAPYALVASNISSTSATVSWTGVGTAFVVQYDTTGFSLGMGGSTTSSTNSVSLTGLMPNTYYDVYVRNNCSGSGNGQSLWSAVATFKTGCVAFNVPFTEDFESTTAGSTSSPNPPDCWSFARTNHGGAGYSYTRNYSTWANNSSQFWYTYTSSNYSTGDTMALISPEINNMDSIDMQLEFYARAGYAGSSYDEVIYVGTISDPSDLSTMSILDTVSIAGILTYTNFLFYFDASNGYNGTDKYMVIVPSSLTTYDYVLIDDITVEEIPACPKPLYPTFTNITDNSANLSFTSGGSKFVIEYGPCGFNQGTGMFDTAYTTSHVLTGLSSNTDYEVYIQSDCSGSGNGLSSWTQSSCFKTECSALATPVSEDFESTTSGSSSNPTTPDCFKYTMTQNGGYGYGYTRNYSTYANSGSQFFYMYHSNTTDTMALVTPQIDSMDVNFKHIQFWARSTSATRSEHIIIGTVSNPNSLADFTPIDSVQINTTTYSFFDVYLDPANGYNQSDKYIAMVLWTGTSYTYGYACIDDISVDDIPSCTPSTNLMVSNISNTGATATWTAGDGLAYDIEYGPTGFTQGTGSPLVSGVTSTSYTISGLNGNTCYDVYVRDSCALAKSPWFGPITFCTPCNPANTPLSEDFEGLTSGGSTVDPNTPDCWTYWENPSSSYYGYSTSSYGPNGSYHWRFYQYNDVDTIALISPAINGMSNGTKQIRLKNMSYYTSTSFQGIAMEIGTTPEYNTVRGGTAVDTIYGDFANTYTTEFTVRFDTNGSAYNGTDQYIYMRPLFQTSKWYGYNFVDDIHVEDIPACAAPWNLSASNITSNAADANWSTVYGTAFQVEYGPTGFIPGTGNGDTINNVMSGATMTGLSPNTYYDFYVSDNCNQSDQAGPFTFKTACVSQLNGNYTIGGTGADFANLDDAVLMLAGCGVSGPTTLTLNNNDTSVIALQSILGGSATNTVVLQGDVANGMDTVFVPSGVQVGLDLMGTSHITFKNLTFVATSVNYLVWLHENANHITFENCHFIMPTASSSAYAVMTATSSATSNYGYGNNADHVMIEDCSFEGGYFNLVINGTSTSVHGTGVTVENSTFRDAYYYGARFYYMDSVEFHNNDVLVDAYTYGYGLYFYYNDVINVTGNKSIAPYYGMYSSRLNYTGSSTASRSLIANNFFISAGTSYGFYMYYPEDVDILHNSVRSASSYGFYISGGISNADIRNNIFYSGSNYALYNTGSATNTTNTSVDYNIYYKGSGSNVARWAGSDYSTLSAWQTADTALNSNSVEGDPGFLSATDLHITGTLPNDVADNNTSISEDIDGDMRPASGSTIKDIGADEFTPLTWDVSLEELLVPLGGCGDSATEVSAVVKNFGINTITTLPITVNLTGGMTGTVNVSAPVNISQGVTDTVFVGTFNTYAGAAGVMFTGYTSLSGDQKNSNDTLMAGPGGYIPFEPLTHNNVDTVCAGIDSVELYALSVPGTLYGWWDAPVGGNKVANGDTIMVPTNGPTTYYVGYDSSSVTPQVGTGTSVTNSTYITPFKTYYEDGRSQYLILASEMAALGVVGGGEISSVSFDVASVGSALSGYSVKMGGTTTSQMTSSFQPNTSFTTVFTDSAYMPVAGLNVHNFSVPFMWNGTDNIIVEVCFDNDAWTSNSSVYYSTLPFDCTTDGYQDGSAGCSATSFSFQAVANLRPNMQFNVKTIGCSNIRKPVSFGVNPDSAYADFTFAVQPNGADVDFNASASMGHVYTWDFGDNNSGTGVMPSHTYTNAGTYNVCLTVEDTVCGDFDTICYDVIATIGIDEGMIGRTMNLYPNPTNGEFRVEFEVEGLEDVEISILSTVGQVIHVEKPGNISGTYQQTFDLSNKAAGVYLLRITTNDHVITRRVTLRR